jgi:hypothetical protein
MTIGEPTLANSAGGSPARASGGATNLGDILERVLDRGLVIAGDIRVNLLDIELLTIKLRLVIASLDTAKQAGMAFWERDPWFVGTDNELQLENERLRSRLEELERRLDETRGIPSGDEDDDDR